MTGAGFNLYFLYNLQSFFIVIDANQSRDPIQMHQLIEFVGNHFLLSAAWVVLFFMILFGFISSQFSAIKQISTHEATVLINRADGQVLDIRAATEFKKGHIINALTLKPEQLKQGKFNSLEKFKDKPIIVVCAMGATAKRTAQQLHKAGFAQVAVLKGGMNAWQGASLPVVK